MKEASDRKDRLERFVRDNREAFDTHEMSTELWGRVLEKMGQQASEETGFVHSETAPKGEDTKIIPLLGKAKGGGILGSPFFTWRVVASAVVLLGFALLAYVNSRYGVTRDPQVALTVPARAREFNDYARQISSKRNELFKLTSANPELAKEFSNDWQRLDNNYQSLRADLADSPDQEVQVQAMIQNLQWQIDLLNRQVDILQHVNAVSDEEKRHSVNL